MKCATYAAYISLSLWWIRLTMHICTGQKLNSAIYPFRNYGLDLEVNEQEEKKWLYARTRYETRDTTTKSAKIKLK